MGLPPVPVDGGGLTVSIGCARRSPANNSEDPGSTPGTSTAAVSSRLVPETNTVEISFTLDRSEFARGTRAILRRSPSVLAIVAIGVFALIAGLTTSNDLLVVVGVAELVTSVVMYGALPGFRWQRNARARARQDHRFTPNAIFVNLLDSESRIAWSYFTKEVQIPGMYVLFHQRTSCNIIPKRAFANREDELTFQRLISAHLKPAPPAAESGPTPELHENAKQDP
jgi:hypothetical protein